MLGSLKPRVSLKKGRPMLELMLVSIVTLLPDYLFRRYVQGKRIGHEITLFSVWYELRWGITLCLILTVVLIMTVLYNHPSSKAVNALFRTVSIFAETGGRVEKVYVGYNEHVKKGQPLIKLDSSRQEAAIDTAKAKIAEVDGALILAKADVLTSEGKLDEAKGNYQQAVDEYETKKKLYERNPDVVARRELEKLKTLVMTREGSVDAAQATKDAAELRVSTILPAQKVSAEAELAGKMVETRS